MGKLKTILIILGILIIALISFAGYTIYQAKQIVEIINDESLKQDIEDLTSGDCSKITFVESKSNEMEIKIRSACKNPVLKYIAEKQIPGRDACAEVNNLNNEAKQKLEEAKQTCNS